jgi:hypothetical protein
MSEDRDPASGPTGTSEIVPSAAKVEQGENQTPTTNSFARRAKYIRFIASAALGGIPWIGGVLAAAVAFQAEGEQEKLTEIQKTWLHEHEEKLRQLGSTINSVGDRLDQLGDDVELRIQSPEYLALIRKGFKAWDQADTEEKREFIRKLLSNAGGTKLCSDDIVRMFIEWIENYHEIHFRVIREIYRDPGLTRARIWENIHGEEPRDDSAEADLFKLLISDLTLGYVIRQPRDTNEHGQFLAKRRTGKGRGPASSVMKSAFDDVKPYVLTELGKQFVHYTMDEIVPRIG